MGLERTIAKEGVSRKLRLSKINEYYACISKQEQRIDLYRK